MSEVHAATAAPPGPNAGLLGFALAGQLRHDPLAAIGRWGRQYGDIAALRLGPYRGYLINQPDAIHEILVGTGKQYRKLERGTRILRRAEGNGLVVSSGDFWRRQRRLIQQAFQTRRLGRYAELIVEYTLRLAAKWHDGATLNIADEMTELTLLVIARALFDLDLDPSQAARLRRAVATLSEEFTREFSAPFLLPEWWPTRGMRRRRWALGVLRRLIWETIHERRAEGIDRGDLLSMLLLAVDEEGDGGGMSDEQAHAEALTLFNAGHDSTAAALAWTWYLVATHDEVAQRLFDEAHRVLAGRPATFDDLPQLRYTEWVVKESLRLYPPTWSLLIREPIEEVELCGYRIPRGSWLYIFPWVTQRDARYFPDPQRFDPQRFAPERAEDFTARAYLPFGGGPHVCIGERFSLMEMTLIVATLVTRWQLRLAEDRGPVVPEAHISIRPRGGLWMTCHERSPEGA